MSRLRIFYILSLVILVVLAIFTVFRPMATGGEYDELKRKSLLRSEDGWILQYDLINREAQDTTYIIDVAVDDKPFREAFLIQSRGSLPLYPSHQLKRDYKWEGFYCYFQRGRSRPL